MFSIQPHNQVLCHLAQLTSVISPRTTPLSVKSRKHNESSINNADTICYESFVEAVKNCTERSIININVDKLVNKIGCKKNNKWIVLDRIFIDPHKETSKKYSRWNISYVSETSFSKNKCGFPCSILTEPIILPAIHFPSKKQYRLFHNIYGKTPFQYNQQVRHFKTERSTNTELKRNPSFSNRIRRWLGKPALTDTGIKESLQNLLKTDDVGKLQTLFANTNLSPEEQKKIKLAFVEGYEAGLQRQQSKMRILPKVVQFFIILSILFMINRWLHPMPGNKRSMFSFQFGHIHEVDPEDVNVTFDDVKGVDDAKKELQDIVEYLKNPEKFTVLGGKLPKGVLLVGPPGTGKTLIARAVAGEAGVPFFYSAGPEFDEVLVGQGARRLRELFKTAKEKAPCVIFIDEIDSVGSKRTSSTLHPYANQTINQLLSEMDGFHQNEGVIVLGATNRPDDLDKAVLRPGRFDFQVLVGLPDYEGRKDILQYYLNKILSRDIDVEFLARLTIGFSGADIEYMINQAALKAAVDEASYVNMKHFEYARDKMLMGPARTIQKVNEKTNKITAFHEAGHAIVALYTKDSDPMYKITIIPRGLSMGHTAFVPEKGNTYETKSTLLARMDVSMGGRVGEEIVFGPDKVTTGAANDFKSATRVAELMVKQYGMSEKAGFRTVDGNDKCNTTNDELIENEIKRLLQESYERARAILKTHAREHKLLAEALLKYETLDAEDVKKIIAGKSPKFPQPEITDQEAPVVDITKNIM